VAALAAIVIAFKFSELHAPGIAPTPADLSAHQCAEPGASCVTCLQHDCIFCGGEAHPLAPGICLAAGSASRCETDLAGVGRMYAFADGCPTPYSVPLLLALMAYLLVFAAGMGPVPWAVNAEIYPLRTRGTASGVAGTVNWVVNGVVSQTFLLLTHALRPSGAFAVYVAIAIVATVWSARYVPETKGLSLAEVQELFERRAGVQASAPGALHNNSVSGHGGIRGTGEHEALVEEGVEVADTNTVSDVEVLDAR
jgi:MFS transporter, SP family, solute carrier family 2 (myo-inositol transporter), member 13